MKLNHTLVALLSVAALLPASASAAELTVKVEGVTAPTGTMFVALFTEDGWAGHEAYQGAKQAVEDDAPTIVFGDLEPGRYGVKLFHDVDGDGELALGEYGIPVEPYGFSNDAPVSFGPPSFDSAAFDVTADGAIQTITLR